ncbi:hypothetical protein JTB14_003528 [Gonioctena quinquepunctata]|nr:hypothetical protein JTB14_003528 [Gonioctena quinquepunctata]
MARRLVLENLQVTEEKLSEKSDQRITKTLRNNQQRQALHYDRTKEYRPELTRRVLMQKEKKHWVPAKIVKSVENPNSCWVHTEHGTIYRRNKFHLKNFRMKEDIEKTERSRHISNERGEEGTNQGDQH